MLPKRDRKAQQQKANAAKTGDIAPIAGMAVLAVAGAAILITRKKK